MASKIDRFMTVAELDTLPDDGNRYELIEGELFVSRAPGIPHQLVLHNLQFEIANYLRRNPIGRLVPGAGAVFSNFDAVIPDLVFVLNENWDQAVTNDRFTGPLDLVIEIISPGKANRRRDVLVKRRLYGKYEAKEYWIVDPEHRSVSIYRLSGQTLEEIGSLMDDEELTSTLLPGLAMTVSAIFNL